MNDENRATSQSNSHKLDQLIMLLEGREDAPGVLAKIALHEEVLFGRRGSNGLVNKVNFMWRAHVWITCTMSALVGFLFREMLSRIKL